MKGNTIFQSQIGVVLMFLFTALLGVIFNGRPLAVLLAVALFGSVWLLIVKITISAVKKWR